MNYMKQLNEFWRIQTLEPISSNAKLLYLALLNINNMGNWEKEFKVNNDFLILLSGLNISAFQRARNELEQKGYIKYQKGKKNQSVPKYTIIKLYEDVVFKNDPNLNTEVNTEPNTEVNIEVNTEPNINPNTEVNTLYKQNKTKLKETKQNKYSSSSENDNTAEDILNHLDRYLDEYDEDVLHALTEFVFMRKQNNKPITGYALKLIINDLKQLASTNQGRLAIINQSITSNWDRFYKLTDKKHSNANNTNAIYANNTYKQNSKVPSNVKQLSSQDMESKVEAYGQLIQ